jgi:hypothetical protein
LDIPGELKRRQDRLKVIAEAVLCKPFFPRYATDFPQ